MTAGKSGLHYPIVIIGGGLAGSAAAAQLALNGWPVTLIERDTFPRDKLCGEFLSGESRELLAQLGCLDAITRHGPAEITNVRFIAPNGKRLDVLLPAPALGISRKVLDQVLFDHARAVGVRCLDGHDVTAVQMAGSGKTSIQMKAGDGEETSCTTDLLLSAYGRRSKIDRNLNRRFLWRLDKSVGIKLHHSFALNSDGENSAAELSGTTEMYILNGGYCGIAPIEGRQVNVCMLLSRRAFAQIKTFEWPNVARYLAAENHELGRRLDTLVPASEQPLTVSQMPFSKREPAGDGVLYIGDAAAMIAPLCGDGMAMALESGILAGQCIERTFRSYKSAAANPIKSVELELDKQTVEVLESFWTTEWSRRFSTRLRAGQILQRAIFNPAIANPLLQILHYAPVQVTRYMAKITRG